LEFLAAYGPSSPKSAHSEETKMINKPREQASPILIVGSMAFDDLELPSANEKNVVGGSATYAALSAALFAPVQIVAVVGSDFPATALSELAAASTCQGSSKPRGRRSVGQAGMRQTSPAARLSIRSSMCSQTFGPSCPPLLRERRS
jgi:hypothetical protein